MYALDPVLVVDDTAPYRDRVRAILSARGYRVSVAADGREGLMRLRAAVEPHIVLLDIVMPVLDGMGLWREVQGDPTLCSAGHRAILMSTARRLGQTDIPRTDGQLVKPFTKQQLVDAVAAIERR